MIRDTWENCRRTTQREFFKWFPPGVVGEYRAGDKEFIWNEKVLGFTGRVTFIGLDAADDASKVASMPLGGFAMDEPAPAAGDSEGISEFIFETAMAQLRQDGMRWYAAKLAQNNPDESHWTYRRFWEPGTPELSRRRPAEQVAGFLGFRPGKPENEDHLPDGYYERMASLWSHRPDLIRRFVEGKPGYQQVGTQVTPEWDDELHLTRNLRPVRGVDLQLCWDGGLNPTCVITQVTPLGDWLVLEAHVGDGIGAYELIEDVIRPRLTTAYRGFSWRHIGDPSMANREQSSSMNSAVRMIRGQLGGPWIPGPTTLTPRLEPLRAVLRKAREGRGIVRVDRDNAKQIWHGLRGGWHYQMHRSGVVGDSPVKDIHSHPCDALSYGAAMLFPLGSLKASKKPGHIQTASYFGGRRRRVPREGRVLFGEVN